MTDKELIRQLKSLQQIKPKKDWVLLTKKQILGEKISYQSKTYKLTYKEILSGILLFFSERKLAYSFLSFMIVFLGIFGFAQYTLPGDMLFSVKKITEQSQAALIGESDIRSSMDNFKKRSHELAEVVKSKKESNKLSAIEEVNNAVKSLSNAIAKDPKSVKEVALELQESVTLLSVEGGEPIVEVKESSDMLYKAIDTQMIEDLKGVTLTESEQATLIQAEDLYSKENYFGALEKILLIDLSTEVQEVKIDIDSE